MSVLSLFRTNGLRRDEDSVFIVGVPPGEDFKSSNGDHGRHHGRELPNWLKATILVIILWVALFAWALLLGYIREHKRQGPGCRFSRARVLWNAFKVALFLWVPASIWTNCCRRRRRRTNSYATVDEDQDSSSDETTERGYSLSAKSEDAPYSEVSTVSAAPSTVSAASSSIRTQPSRPPSAPGGAESPPSRPDTFRALTPPPTHGLPSRLGSIGSLGPPPPYTKAALPAPAPTAMPSHGRSVWGYHARPPENLAVATRTASGYWPLPVPADEPLSRSVYTPARAPIGRVFRPRTYRKLSNNYSRLDNSSSETLAERAAPPPTFATFSPAMHASAMPPAPPAAPSFGNAYRVWARGSERRQPGQYNMGGGGSNENLR